MNKLLKKLGVLTVIFILINVIVNYVYELPAKNAIKNKIHKNYLKWGDIHKNKNSYDLIVIGASRAYTSFNPTIIDSSLHLNSYNMGTSAQDIAESYYTLKEVLDHQKPKYVVLDLFFPSSDNTHDYYQIFSNASFFESNENKFDLITQGYGATGIYNYCVPVVKFKNYLKQDINNLVSKGSSPKPEFNWIKGFLYDTITVTKLQIAKFTPISNYQNTNFNQKRFTKYLKKIIDLTKSKNITFIGVRTPYPPSRLALNDTNDEGDYFRTYTSNNSIYFFDLNTYNNKTYPYLDTDFSDYHHPNYRGAYKASLQLVTAIKEINN